ncbi:ATP-dependent DNA helicase [Prolixibacter bellariivorans]|nr:AAA family ATPase [Prolixibacter bellariivorans]
MLKNHVKNSIYEVLGFEPTESQRKMIDLLSGYITSPHADLVFLLKGYAGTGKTSVVSALVKVLGGMKIRTVLLAPTGRAAKVLSHYAHTTALTIHKKIYRQQSTTDGTGRFLLDRNLHKDTVFIVDEASMISNLGQENSIFGSGHLLDDLVEYVYSGKNCRLILVGDVAQLPPVGLDMSPALYSQELEYYNLEVLMSELSDVVRQEADSGILHNATKIRNQLDQDDEYGFWSIETEGFDDIIRLSGDELIEEISSCYGKYGMEETMIVTRSNKRANKFNEGIRRTVLYREEELSTGDLLMVVKNNYYWAKEIEELDFIANGDIAEIIRIRKYEELYGFRFANVTLRFIDYKDVEIDCKIFLDTLMHDGASFTSAENKKLFEGVAQDYLDIRNKRQRWEKIRENEYFNALQVKFAYAVTCHKAQGGQWKAVFVDHGYLTEEMIDREYLRWMYTAFTRPTERLYLVNFRKEFFGE